MTSNRLAFTLLAIIALSAFAEAQQSIQLQRAKLTRKEKLLFVYFLGGLDAKTRSVVEAFLPATARKSSSENAAWPEVKITNYLNAQ